MGALLIANGRVIDPASGVDGVGDVLVAGGVVAAVTLRPEQSGGDGRSAGPRGMPGGVRGGVRVIDATGLLVVPGLIDPHVHLREPGGEHKETIATGTLAAVAGGFTAVCCMPNTQPAIDSPEMVAEVRERAAATGRCRVLVSAAGTVGRRGEVVTEVGLLKRAGAVAITDDGDGVPTAGVMLRVLEACAGAGLVFMQHAQDASLTPQATMNAGALALRVGQRGWPAVAEEVMVQRDIALVEHMVGRMGVASGFGYHVQHVSSGGTVGLIREARRRGLPVSGEASPHHLLLTESAVVGRDGALNTHAKMNPPLRGAGDVEALRAGVGDGTLTVLATDHAPHSAEEKARPFEEAPFGIIGLEFAVGLYGAALVEAGVLGWPRLVELMTVEPARLLGVGPGASAERLGELGLPGMLGSLAVGASGDVTLIDAGAVWGPGPEVIRSKSRNSPFTDGSIWAGRARGRVVATVVGGEVVYEAGPVVSGRAGGGAGGGAG